MRLISTIFYAFSTPIMPPQTYAHLQETIEQYNEMLEDSTLYRNGWYSPRSPGHPSSALKSWQSDVPALYDVSKFHKSMAAAIAENSAIVDEKYLNLDSSKSMGTEYECYGKTLFLFSHHSLMTEDPQLMQLYHQS